MRNLYILLLFSITSFSYGQDNNSLLNHYKQYYEQMKSQGDIQGVINGLTHLNILDPSQARADTLAVLYMNEGRHVQALNTIGIESNKNDSDMAVEEFDMNTESLLQSFDSYGFGISKYLDGNNLKMQLSAYKADFNSGNEITYGEFLVQIAF